MSFYNLLTLGAVVVLCTTIVFMWGFIGWILDQDDCPETPTFAEIAATPSPDSDRYGLLLRQREKVTIPDDHQFAHTYRAKNRVRIV